jgi:hypothetical protein
MKKILLFGALLCSSPAFAEESISFSNSAEVNSFRLDKTINLTVTPEAVKVSDNSFREYRIVVKPRSFDKYHGVKRLEAGWQVINILDIWTSLDIKNHPGYYERNPLLPKHPTDEQFIHFGVVNAIAHYAITKTLIKLDVDPKIVKAWEYLTISTKTAAVANNLAIGLKFKL